jgi:hypothetical protein
MALNESQSMALPLNLEWYAIDKAVSYKVTLMTTDSQVWEKTTLDPEVLIEDINPGQYEVLIRGIDEEGFEGRNRRLNLVLPEDNI